MIKQYKLLTAKDAIELDCAVMWYLSHDWQLYGNPGAIQRNDGEITVEYFQAVTAEGGL